MLERVYFFKRIAKDYKFITGVSFSQNYEDLFFLKLRDDFRLRKDNGFYVDIGAHDPIRFSNTYNLHLLGWRGLNIDPLPGCMDKFNKLRPDDINLPIGISDSTSEMKYFSFEEPAYNTFNSDRANFIVENKISVLKEEKNVKVDTLANVFSKYIIGGGGKIDLLTLDVEAMELSVLKSNNWDLFRPDMIIMESLSNVRESLDQIYKDPAIVYLCEKKYAAVAKVGNSVFLKDFSNLREVENDWSNRINGGAKMHDS